MPQIPHTEIANLLEKAASEIERLQEENNLLRNQLNTNGTQTEVYNNVDIVESPVIEKTASSEQIGWDKILNESNKTGSSLTGYNLGGPTLDNPSSISPAEDLKNFLENL